jgi:cyclic nucleotide gated channel
LSSNQVLRIMESIQIKSWGGIIFKYWHAMFVVSCVIAVLCVDPLFFYLPVINQDHKCLALDRRLKVTAICVRSVFDLIYLVNIILGCLCPYKDEDASRRCERIVLVTDAPTSQLTSLLFFPSHR